MTPPRIIGAAAALALLAAPAFAQQGGSQQPSFGMKDDQAGTPHQGEVFKNGARNLGMSAKPGYLQPSYGWNGGQPRAGHADNTPANQSPGGQGSGSSVPPAPKFPDSGTQTLQRK